jgi:16S rRNA (adenine1518-N6/adenine1519-N6)-dimethyltransferase
MQTSRQTVSYLRRRFEEVGLNPIKKRGQNFLIDLNLLDVLIREADLQPDDVVLEVGTGTGSLTARMSARVAAVVTVEIDEHLCQLAREELYERTNVEILRQDVLRNKNQIHAHVMETVYRKIDELSAARYKLVANLPYCIATPVISNLLLADRTPQSMTVTIQKELADRITARPSTKDYSALSIWVQSLCDTRLVRAIPPSAFWPRPKVESAILRVTPIRAKRERISDLHAYHTFVRSLFFHRRKFLRSVLLSSLKGQLDKPQVDALMQELHLGGDSRAEQLDIPMVITLFDRVRRLLNPAGNPAV